MKTDDEIKSYLQKHLWYHQYDKNMLRYRGTLGYYGFLNGRESKYTITNAFMWNCAFERYSFWCILNLSFLEWFNGISD